MAELFETVRGCSDGAVVFVDEIDVIGASRSRRDASEPSRRLLNQLLNELDGVHGHGTDRPVGQADLDEALRRVRPSVSPESLQR